MERCPSCGAPARPGAKFLQGNLFAHVAVMSLTSSVGLMVLFAVALPYEVNPFME